MMELSSVMNASTDMEELHSSTSTTSVNGDNSLMDSLDHNVSRQVVLEYTTPTDDTTLEYNTFSDDTIMGYDSLTEVQRNISSEEILGYNDTNYSVIVRICLLGGKFVLLRSRHLDEEIHLQTCDPD